MDKSALPVLTTNDAVKVGAVALGSVIAVGSAAAVVHHIRKNRKRKARKNKSVRKRASRGRKLKFGSKAYRKKYLRPHRRNPYTAGKRRDTSRRRIRYTSKGQPYVIGKGGKARFISKRSASSSYKREGGKY